jgi:hypothetical protein
MVCVLKARLTRRMTVNDHLDGAQSADEQTEKEERPVTPEPSLHSDLQCLVFEELYTLIIAQK